MKNRQEHLDLLGPLFLRDLWREYAGISTPSPVSDPLESLRRSEWSQEFEQLMRNRLVMGAFRYGKIGDSSKPRWDRMGRIQKEAELFLRDKNGERLVDIANMAMLMFIESGCCVEAKDEGGYRTVKS